MSSSSGGKSEQPTQKRLRDARKQGQVAVSRDLTLAIGVLTVSVFLWMTGKSIATSVFTAFRSQFELASNFSGMISEGNFNEHVLDGFWAISIIVLPLFLVIWLVATIFSVIQTRALVSFGLIKPSIANLRPGRVLGAFDSQALVNLVSGLGRALLIFSIVCIMLWYSRSDVLGLSSRPLPESADYIFDLAIQTGFLTGIAFLVFGIADYANRLLHLNRELRMSRREIKEELKQTEGNPQMKKARQRVHRSLEAQNFPELLKDASFVISGHERLAVAITYRKEEMRAPIITIKGKGEVALRILDLAKDLKLPIANDHRLADILVRLKTGNSVPAKHFESIARLIKWSDEVRAERNNVR